MKPGETATARYTINAAADAGVKEYALDTEIRYRDALDNSQISDTFKVPVNVVGKPASAGMLLPLLAVIVLIVVGAGYYLLVMRKKK